MLFHHPQCSFQHHFPLVLYCHPVLSGKCYSMWVRARKLQFPETNRTVTETQNDSTSVAKHRIHCSRIALKKKMHPRKIPSFKAARLHSKNKCRRINNTRLYLLISPSFFVRKKNFCSSLFSVELCCCSHKKSILLLLLFLDQS